MGVRLGSPEEETVRVRLIEEHPKWTIELDGTRRWVVRRGGELLGRHMDIVIAGEAAVIAERAR